jgi:hypothetical protein
MNKGFKALPEHVQRKIDPEMAKKFEDGGAVMGRPLFQQGVNGLSIAPGFGGAGGNHPIFKSLGMSLNSAVTRAVPEFVDNVESQAKDTFGEKAFELQQRPYFGGLGDLIGQSGGLGIFSQLGSTNQEKPSFAEGGPVMDPQQMLGQAEQAAQQEGAQIGQMLAQKLDSDLENATDPKSMIDAIRGDNKPIQDRYMELASFVGENDAAQTPESVLAMVQPTIMLTEEGAIDSGVGQLMQGLLGEAEMAQDSPMSQGVGELMAMGAGNTPPANFRHGGAVRHYAPGGKVAKGAAAYMPEFQELYASVLGDQASRDAELAERKKMTKAQMLFDLAQAGLAFAGETEGSSIAERLANATSKSQLFDKLGTRAAGQLEAKRAMDAERRQMDLAAVQSSIAASQSDVSAKQAMELAAARQTGIDTDYKRVVTTDGTDLGTFNVKDPKRRDAFEAALRDNPGARAFNLGTEPKSDQTDFKSVTLYPVDGKGEPVTMPATKAGDIAAIMERLKLGKYTEDDTAYKSRIEQEAKVDAEKRETDTKTLYSLTSSSKPPKSFNVKDPKQKKEYDELLASQKWTADSKAYDIALAKEVEQNQYDRNRKDFLEDIESQVERDIDEEERKLGYDLDKEGRDQVEFNRRLAAETNLQIESEQRALRRELRAEERANAEYRARLAVQEQMKIREETRILEERGNYTIRSENGQIVAVDNKTLEVTPIFGTPDVGEPEYAEITLPSADGTPVTTIVDITSPSGKQAIALINEVSRQGGEASMQKISTASVTPRGFFIPEKGVFTSYDGGRTYLDGDGKVQAVPGGAFEVSNQIAYDVSKNEKIRANALQQLAEMDVLISSAMTKATGEPLSAEEQREVIDAYEAARKGTGFWAKVLAGVDAVVGGVTGGKVSVRIDKQDARQFVRMIRVLGRSALAASPRFAVADLQTTETLFPNEQTLLSSPKTEARKLISLKTEINNEKERILTLFASGTPLESSMKATLNQKLFEIERLNQMLGSVDTIFASEATQGAINDAKNLIKQNVKKGNRAGGGNE